MLAQLADLRFCALMSCDLKSAALCRRSVKFLSFQFHIFLPARCLEQARSQKLAMGGGGGLFWESEGGAPSARKFCIFLQKELNFRAILMKNNAFKTLHRNWQCKHD